MNNKTLVGLVAFVALVAGVVGGYAANKLSSNQPLGGDFAGGLTPSQLITGSASGGITGNGYVQPNGTLSLSAPTGLSVGTPDQYHGQTEYATASGTPSSVVTLNAFNNATGTAATTSIVVPETQGLSIGAICSGGAATTTLYVSGCILTSTNNATGTALVAYSNITGSSISVPTSTRLNITFDQLPY